MRFLILALLLVTRLVSAEDLNGEEFQELTVLYSSAAEVETLLENKQGLTDVAKTLEITSPKPRTIQLSFSKTYSNKCIAANHIVLPEANLTNDRVTVALGQTFRKMACPMVFQPTLVTFHITLKGLKEGSNYRVKVGTKNKLFKKTIRVQ